MPAYYRQLAESSSPSAADRWSRNPAANDTLQLLAQYIEQQVGLKRVALISRER